MMKAMKHVIVGTAGHIDHGKSALVQALTGTDPDRLKEEKERGITIDLGFAFLNEPGELALGFIDVPGHERFVKNMLAGVGGIDLVMLVVAADESVMPQTREHFEICRLLQIQQGIIVITKADLVESDLREVAAIEVRELVEGSFLEKAPLVFVSSKTGEGIDQLKQVLFQVAGEVKTRPSTGVFRLPVDRVFSMKGFGTVATGTLISGSVGLDEEVEILPRGITARVRGLHVHGQTVERAFAGQRTAVNLQGVEVAEVARGDTLAKPRALAASMMLDADLQVLRTSPMPIKDLARVHLHLGTAQVVARVRVLGGAGTIPAGERGWVQFRLEAPVVAAPGDRFIVRRYSPLDTIGGGRIQDAAPPKHAVSGLDVVDELRAMSAGSVESASLFVRQAEARGLGGVALSQRLGVDEETLGRVVESLVEKGYAFRISEDPLLLLSSPVAEEIAGRLVQILESFQKANPLRDGMPKGELREKAAGKAPVEIFEWILGRAVGAGEVQVTRDRVATSDHKIQLTPAEADARGFLTETYLEARCQPPTLAEMAARGKRDPKLVERIERLLLQEGTLVKVADGMIFHREVLKELKQALGREKAKGDRIDVAFFKQLAGVTRKHAIPLLEWLDRERVTRRVGKDRVVL